MNQIITQLNAVTFTASDAGCRVRLFMGRGRSRATGCGYGCGFHHKPPQYVRGPPQGSGFPCLPPPPGSGFQGGPARVPAYVHPSGPPPQNLQWPPQYRAPAVAHLQANVQQLPYSNVVKRYPNWNVCSLCGFDVAKGHNSMSCPPHLRKASHDIYFNCQNAQQYIDLGRPCSTGNRHKTQLPTMWWLGAANVDASNDANCIHVNFNHSLYPPDGVALIKSSKIIYWFYCFFNSGIPRYICQ